MSLLDGSVEPDWVCILSSRWSRPMAARFGWKANFAKEALSHSPCPWLPRPSTAWVSLMDSKFFKTLRRIWEADEPEIPPTPKPEFELKETRYDMPPPENYDLYHLDPQAKRKMTVCNLFVNHNKTIAEIVELLEVTKKFVIDALIENNLIKDRRKRTVQIQPDRREK